MANNSTLTQMRYSQQFPSSSPGRVGSYPMTMPAMEELYGQVPQSRQGNYVRPTLSPQPAQNPFADIAWNRGSSYGNFTDDDINMPGVHELGLASAWNQNLLPSNSTTMQSGNYPGSMNYGGPSSGGSSSSGGSGSGSGGQYSGQSAGGLTGNDQVNRVLQSYDQAYRDYMNAVEGRYQDTMAGMSDRYQRGVAGSSGLQNDVLTGHENRYQRGMDIVDQYGDQSKKDINEIYDSQMAGNLQGLTSRGLTGYTILPTMQLGTQRQRADALSRENERMMRERLAADSGLSGDALAAQERMGQYATGTDAALSGDFLNMMASRNDIPPDLNQLLSLANAAGQSGVGQPSWLDMLRALGGSGGGNMAGDLGGWNAPLGLAGGGGVPNFAAPNWGAGGASPSGSPSRTAASPSGSPSAWTGNGWFGYGDAAPASTLPGWANDVGQFVGGAIANPYGAINTIYDGVTTALGRSPGSVEEAQRGIEEWFQMMQRRLEPMNPFNPNRVAAPQEPIAIEGGPVIPGWFQDQPQEGWFF